MSHQLEEMEVVARLVVVWFDVGIIGMRGIVGHVETKLVVAEHNNLAAIVIKFSFSYYFNTNSI